MITQGIFTPVGSTGSMLVGLIISVQLVCGCLISIPEPVHSQTADPDARGELTINLQAYNHGAIVEYLYDLSLLMYIQCSADHKA